MARKLFGTDGIRGVAGEYPLDARTAQVLGGALGTWVEKHQPGGSVVIGMDTRESGPWLASAVAGGLHSRGIRVEGAGIITTPGLAYLVKTGPFAAAVMISASHNPYEDNGIKIFGHSGYKLPDLEEERLESEMFRLIEQGFEADAVPVEATSKLEQTYLDYLCETIGSIRSEWKVVVDCANGAASYLAPMLLGRVGAQVTPLCTSPNGKNINLHCGSLHLQNVREEVLRTGAHFGVAFDGDADRALFVSHSGKIIDGDAILLICARQLKASGRLGEPTVVGTVMSNVGLELALAEEGIRLVRTPVGDKYVLEKMLETSAKLGGEQSGHIIFREYATTGDGMLTALQVLEVMDSMAKDLDELTKDLQVFPQRIVNVRIRDRKPLHDFPSVQREIAEAESCFGKHGRVVVRFSGTEPLARVMVEGPDPERVEYFANQIAAQIQSELG